MQICVTKILINTADFFHSYWPYCQGQSLLVDSPSVNARLITEIKIHNSDFDFDGGDPDSPGNLQRSVTVGNRTPPRSSNKTGFLFTTKRLRICPECETTLATVISSLLGMISADISERTKRASNTDFRLHLIVAQEYSSDRNGKCAGPKSRACLHFSHPHPQ